MSAQDRQTLSLPSLRNLQAFIAVANALSIHQAAEQLNVTPPRSAIRSRRWSRGWARNYSSAAARGSAHPNG